METSSRIISGGNDKLIRQWNPNSGEESLQFNDHYGGITSLCFNSSTNIMASASHDSSIKLWNISDCSVEKTLLGHSRAVNSIYFSPNGDKLVSGSDDQTLKIWDVSTGDIIIDLDMDERKIFCVHWNRDGSCIAVANERVHIIAADTGKDVVIIDTGAFSVVFCNTCNNLAIAKIHGYIDLVDSITGELLLSFCDNKFGRILSLSFNYDDTKLASTFGKTIKVWDTTDKSNPTVRNPLHTLTGHKDVVYSICFDLDDNKLASACDDGTVMLWEDGECLRTFEGHTSKANAVCWCNEIFDYLLK